MVSNVSLLPERHTTDGDPTSWAIGKKNLSDHHGGRAELVAVQISVVGKALTFVELEF